MLNMSKDVITQTFKNEIQATQYFLFVRSKEKHIDRWMVTSEAGTISDIRVEILGRKGYA